MMRGEPGTARSEWRVRYECPNVKDIPIAPPKPAFLPSEAALFHGDRTETGSTSPCMPEYELTRSLLEELKSSLPTIEELEAELAEAVGKGDDTPGI